MRRESLMVLAGFVMFLGSLAQAAPPETVLWETDIEYSSPGDEHLQLNLARPKTGTGPFPTVLCIHGGGFRAGKRESYDVLCQKLAERGYVAATITYRLAPKHQFPAAVHDTKAAVRWLRANASKYHIDPHKIGVTGGSAGGHLAQFLGVTANVPQFEGTGGNPTQPSSVTCVVNVYGPSDFTKSYGKSVDLTKCCHCGSVAIWRPNAICISREVRCTGSHPMPLRHYASTVRKTSTSPTSRQFG